MSLEDALRAHYAEEAAEEARLAEAYLAGALGADEEERALLAALEPTPRAAQRWPLLAAAALLLLGVGLWPRAVEPPASPPALSAKGAPAWRLEVGARRGGVRFVVRDGARLATGDALGFFVSGDRPGYVRVLYLSSEGIAQLAPTQDRDGAFPAGRQHPLPEGAQLTPSEDECEWIVALFDEAPLEEGDVERRLSLGEGGCAPPEVEGAATILRILR